MARAQNWVKLAPATSPSPRAAQAMAYDAAHQKVVLYGGANSTGLLSETWTWDGVTWSQQSPTTVPPARDNSCMAYDQFHQRVVMFGGQDNSNNLLSETWLWDGSNWTPGSPSTVPAARINCAMTYDEVNQQIVMFGGSAGPADTWVWDGSNWTQKNPATVPSDPFQIQALTFDEARQEVVLMTVVQSAGAYVNQTWGWNGSNWTLKTPAANIPARNVYNGFAYDAALQKVVAFGGQPLPRGAKATDTWTWDGSNWTQLITTTTPPAFGPVMVVYDGARQQALMFGEVAAGVILNDTWVLNASGSSISITVPAGIQFSFNGVSYTGSQVITIAPGTYTLSTTSPQAAGAGTQAVFTGWSDGGAITHDVTVGASGVSITGTFSTQYLLSAAANPSNGGTVSQTGPASNGPYYNPGTVVSVFQQASPGFNFTGWSGACSGTGACFVTMNAPATVTANFARPTYLVSINVPAAIQYSLGGLPLTGPANIVLPTGNYDLVLASPQAVSTGVQTAFVSWSDGGLQSHTISVLSGPVSVTGTFKTQYLLTYVALPNSQGSVGASIPGPSDPWYDAGSSVIVQATANPTYEFESWQGACTGSNPLCFVVMSAPKSVTGLFSTSLQWVPLFPANSPPVRDEALLAYDAARRQVVLFGGILGGIAYNDTWVWDGVNWTQKFPAHTPPPTDDSRSSQMAYDAARERVVMFAFGGNWGLPGQTWLWDGSDWTRVFPAASPLARSGGSMVYDAARQEIVLAGGDTGGCYDHAGCWAGDTWTWNGSNWIQKFPATPLPGRETMKSAWDAVRQEMVVFGGYDQTGPTNETWTWNGSNWTRKSPVNSPRYDGIGGAMAWDAIAGQAVLLNPTDSLTQPNPAQTWLWDGTNWTLKTYPLGPLHREADAAAWDAARQQIVLFGGGGLVYDPNYAGDLNDTWVYTTLHPPMYSVNSTVTPPGTGTVTPYIGSQPGPSYFAGTTVLVNAVPTQGWALLNWSGACSGNGPCYVTLDSNKSLTATFTNAPQTVTITVPAGIQFTFNGVTYTGTQTLTVAPGTYPLSAPLVQATGPGVEAAFFNWSDGNPASRSITVGAAPFAVTGSFTTKYQLTTAALPANQGTVSPASGLYYAAGTNVAVTATASPGYPLQYWSGDCTGASTTCTVRMDAPRSVTANFGPLQTWVRAFPATSPPAPDNIFAGSMTFDELRQQMVLYRATGNASETWIYDGSNWIQKQPATSPSPRYGASMAYDRGNAQAVLFGGATPSGAPNGETWVWDGSSWIQKFPVTSPGHRELATMAYDATRGNVVLFGGALDGQNFSSESWSWDGSNWTQLQPQHVPPMRSGHTLTWDAAHQVLVLFGGYSGIGFGALNDTWLWDGTDWLEQAPLNKPPARGGHMGAYDALHQQTLIFGGLAESFNDTWAWDGANWYQRVPAVIPTGRQFGAMAYDSVRQQPVMFGGVADAFLNDTWVWLTPSVSLVPQTPVIVKDGLGNYIVTVTLRNQGNVTVTSVSLTTAKLGAVNASAVAGPPANTPVAPGATLSFSAKFPTASVPGRTASLTFSGGYTSSFGPASTWSVGLRSINLP